MRVAEAGDGEGGEEGRVRVQQWKAVRKTHKLIHQRFKSISKQRWKNFCTNEPKVPRLEKNKYTEVEREEITSLREKTEKKILWIPTCKYKSKAINHVGEPSFLAAPSRQRQNEMGQD